MSSEIEALMSRIEPDPWRSKTGFSSEMRAALDVTLNSKSFEEIESALTAWIRKYQPCLFGRIAAKQSAITYCLITEEMLCGDEAKLKDHIREARRRWTAAGFDGASSNFVIAVLSKRLAFGLPSEAVEKIALRLCTLYLGESIEPDRVYLDRLWLQQPGSQKATWEWVCGRELLLCAGRRKMVAGSSIPRRNGLFSELGWTHGQIGKANSGSPRFGRGNGHVFAGLQSAEC